MKIKSDFSYPERWRDCALWNPATINFYIEMVLIPAKQMLWEMRGRDPVDIYMQTFLLILKAERFFVVRMRVKGILRGNRAIYTVHVQEYLWVYSIFPYIQCFDSLVALLIPFMKIIHEVSVELPALMIGDIKVIGTK